MKTTRKIMAAMLSAAVMGSLSVAAFAEDAPKGHIIFAADKNTIGQGFVTEPVSVPFYEGDDGIDIIKRAAEIEVTESDYGAYISAFADEDTGESIPAQIAEVCPEMNGRTKDGYLSSYDYTAESGWSYFINDEYAMVGISDYVPADGDTVWFRFSVYGYGCDLGIDNSSWGGSPALVEQTKTVELMKLLADNKGLSDTDEYKAAIAVLESYGASQADIDAAAEALSGALTEEEPEADVQLPENTEPKDSPDTGAEGVAVVIGLTAAAGAALVLSRKR